MWMMNLVWPITALYSGPLGLWAYYRIGHLTTHERVLQAQERGEESPGKPQALLANYGHRCHALRERLRPRRFMCRVLIFAVPLTLFGKPIFAAWVLDYLLAFTFGIAFQYATITPMRQLSPSRGLLDDAGQPTGRTSIISFIPSTSRKYRAPFHQILTLGR
jgi:Domain of unknown function (DUF4396)